MKTKNKKKKIPKSDYSAGRKIFPWDVFLVSTKNVPAPKHLIRKMCESVHTSFSYGRLLIVNWKKIVFYFLFFYSYQAHILFQKFENPINAVFLQ